MSNLRALGIDQSTGAQKTWEPGDIIEGVAEVATPSPNLKGVVFKPTSFSNASYADLTFPVRNTISDRKDVATFTAAGTNNEVVSTLNIATDGTQRVIFGSTVNMESVGSMMPSNFLINGAGYYVANYVDMNTFGSGIHRFFGFTGGTAILPSGVNSIQYVLNPDVGTSSTIGDCNFFAWALNTTDTSGSLQFSSVGYSTSSGGGTWVTHGGATNLTPTTDANRRFLLMARVNSISTASNLAWRFNVNSGADVSYEFQDTQNFGSHSMMICHLTPVLTAGLQNLDLQSNNGYNNNGMEYTAIELPIDVNGNTMNYNSAACTSGAITTEATYGTLSLTVNDGNRVVLLASIDCNDSNNAAVSTFKFRQDTVDIWTGSEFNDNNNNYRQSDTIMYMTDELSAGTYTFDLRASGDGNTTINGGTLIALEIDGNDTVVSGIDNAISGTATTNEYETIASLGFTTHSGANQALIGLSFTHDLVNDGEYRLLLDSLIDLGTINTTDDLTQSDARLYLTDVLQDGDHTVEFQLKNTTASYDATDANMFAIVLPNQESGNDLLRDNVHGIEGNGTGVETATTGARTVGDGAVSRRVLMFFSSQQASGAGLSLDLNIDGTAIDSKTWSMNDGNTYSFNIAAISDVLTPGSKTFEVNPTGTSANSDNAVGEFGLVELPTADGTGTLHYNRLAAGNIPASATFADVPSSTDSFTSNGDRQYLLISVAQWNTTTGVSSLRFDVNGTKYPSANGITIPAGQDKPIILACVTDKIPAGSHTIKLEGKNTVAATATGTNHLVSVIELSEEIEAALTGVVQLPVEVENGFIKCELNAPIDPNGDAVDVKFLANAIELQEYLGFSTEGAGQKLYSAYATGLTNGSYILKPQVRTGAAQTVEARSGTFTAQT